MYKKVITITTLFAISNPFLLAGRVNMVPKNTPYITEPKNITLDKKSISLSDRYANDWVNNVYKDNILLTLDYISGDVKKKSDIVWEKVEKPKHTEFSLKPGEAFAFHEQILPEFNNIVVKTTNAHFNYQDGFKSDGYLTGDGVCHLASLLYWVSKDAGLRAYAPTNHDFAVINEVPKEYGVSIYNLPGAYGLSARQNLYITNNLGIPVIFTFNYDGVNLTIEIAQSH